MDNSTIKLQKEHEYFLSNLNDLATKYNGKYVVVKDEAILGVYETEELAINKTLLTQKLGTFLVRKCSKDTNVYKQTFHSRVSFN